MSVTRNDYVAAAREFIRSAGDGHQRAPDVEKEPSPEFRLAAAELIERYSRRTNQSKGNR